MRPCFYGYCPYVGRRVHECHQTRGGGREHMTCQRCREYGEGCMLVGGYHAVLCREHRNRRAIDRRAGRDYPAPRNGGVRAGESLG